MFFYSSPECHLFRPISQCLNPPQKSQSEVSLSCVVVGGRSKDEDLVWFLFSWEEPEMFIMFNVCGLKSGQTFEAVFNQIRLATL